ncbi:MAG: hypothetical protein KBS55_00980 [Bacteroidales bacterium]|nr:hypothetical protein [Candidatus Cryptobacteroides aphodequi]
MKQLLLAAALVPALLLAIAATSFADDNLPAPAVPDIPEMVSRTTGQYSIGVQCHPDRTVLEWVSERLMYFCRDLAFVRDAKLMELREDSGVEDIVEYYFQALGGENSAREPLPFGDPVPQGGILLTEVCWLGHCCTMQRDVWEDSGNAGNHTVRQWFTIDTRTGRVLRLDDIIRRKGFADFADQAVKFLRVQDGGLWTEYHSFSDSAALIAGADGCALVQEGVLVWYNPYSIASGNEGVVSALVPYHLAAGNLRSCL